MKIKRILITGDDGYNSIGTRILVRMLRDKYDLSIAATNEQQSGVGGKMTLDKKHMKWGKEKVEGVEAIWVDGTPVDAVEFAQGYFKKKFDLVISGINLGENIGVALFSSGTFAAAVRSIGVMITDRCISMSMMANSEADWLHNHSGKDNIQRKLKYPGEVVIKMLNLCLSEDFFGTNIVNINFPVKPTNKYRFTNLERDITQHYTYPVRINKSKMVWSQQDIWTVANSQSKPSPDSDVHTIRNGIISVTPIDWLSRKLITKSAGKIRSL